MKKAVGLLVVIVMAITTVGCAAQERVNTPKDFPYISFVIPNGYQIYYEEVYTGDQARPIFRTTLHNPKSDTYLSVSYEAIYSIKDGDWANNFREIIDSKGEYHNDYVLPQSISETDGYTIHHMAENCRFLVLPTNWNEVVGVVSVAYDHFYLADLDIKDGRFFGETINTSNGDIEAAKTLAESITKSTLTYEEYERITQG